MAIPFGEHISLRNPTIIAMILDSFTRDHHSSIFNNIKNPLVLIGNSIKKTVSN